MAFTLVTLPVEFNASSRAREMLMRNGLVNSQQEAQGVKAMLNAAALTYVAAAAQAIAQLLYFPVGAQPALGLLQTMSDER